MKCFKVNIFENRDGKHIWKTKTQLTIAFFTAVNHNYDDNQWTLIKRNKQDGSKSTNHNPMDETF